ncbi:hypothetical protein NE852_03260 [Rhizobium sp. Pop5]|uniref:hypothetical protein n=1 Tax=Rhizobium sp. Pop5 TaxID=1223565 RepID=UPI000283C347|nr:hypothetical protein [Rhizobium sp. Pop5]EJZ22450.1 hypothetical protein RCCGEPOP_04781 [Rhizobium sp. Pop5]UVD57244.1 hypothetical protein NE852_03260 [Rhizobium sp. Pop5]
MAFNFIPNPQGNGLSDEEFIASAMQMQKHHEEMLQQRIEFAVIGIVVLFALIFVCSKYRKISRAASEGFLNSAAAIVRAKRNAAQAISEAKAKIQERADGD